jgi:hypothetical protein
MKMSVIIESMDKEALKFYARDADEC